MSKQTSALNVNAISKNFVVLDFILGLEMVIAMMKQISLSEIMMVVTVVETPTLINATVVLVFLKRLVLLDFLLFQLQTASATTKQIFLTANLMVVIVVSISIQIIVRNVCALVVVL